MGAAGMGTNATHIFLIGDATGWKEKAPFELKRQDPDGV
jgi:hypothetical protein